MQNIYKKESICEFCNSNKISLEYCIKDDSIYKCNRCGIMFSDFDKEKSKLLYNKSYYSSDDNNEGYSNYNGMSVTHKSTFEKRLDFIERNYKEGGLVLDFGCALGHFCEVAKNRNWNVIGSDINTYAAEFVKKKYNVDTFICDISNPPIKNNIADLVCLYDLIEHVPNPKKSLKAIKNILKDDGILHIVTPDSNSISSIIFGRYWFHYKPKEHLFYFNKHNLSKILKQMGYNILKVRSNTSYMTLKDIFIRLSSYLGILSDFIIKILSFFHLNDFVIPIYVGNLEIIATPSKLLNRKTNNQLKISTNDIFKCPSCSGQISITDTKVICDQCSSVFGYRKKIPNFLII